jgi:hypothetical protein
MREKTCQKEDVLFVERSGNYQAEKFALMDILPVHAVLLCMGQYIAPYAKEFYHKKNII